MKETQFVHRTEIVLHDFHHREKLFVSFGLITKPNWVHIRIIKNLDVGGDCRTAIEYPRAYCFEGYQLILSESE